MSILEVFEKQQFKSIILSHDRGVLLPTRLVRVTPKSIQCIDEMEGQKRVVIYEMESGQCTVDGIPSKPAFRDAFLAQFAALVEDARDPDGDTEIYLESEGNDGR